MALDRAMLDPQHGRGGSTRVEHRIAHQRCLPVAPSWPADQDAFVIGTA
jgi:hypothetical protein